MSRVFLSLLVLALCLTVSVVSAAFAEGDYTKEALADEIINLPGLPESGINFRHFSGYLQVAPERKIFYWFVEADAAQPEEKPLFFWTNGGPGCSGLSGFMTEQGPFRPQKDGSLNMNTEAWNKLANVVFIEQPAGVGFSTNSEANPTFGDEKSASDNYVAMQEFVKRFPTFTKNNNKVYITSESYGGHYLPTLALKIVMDSDKKFNFKGLAVGNPLTYMPYRNYGQFGTAAGHQLLPKPLWDQYLKLDCKTADPVTLERVHEAQCQHVEGRMSDLLADLDPYALDFPTCDDFPRPGMKMDFHFTQQSALLHKANKLPKSFYARMMQTVMAEPALQEEHSLEYNHLNNILEKEAPASASASASASAAPSTSDYFPAVYEPCTNGWNTDYLNRKDVQKAIHVSEEFLGGHMEWSECNMKVNSVYNMTDVNAPMMPFYTAILKATVHDPEFKVMVFSGDDDSICATMGSQEFIWDLGLDISTPWGAWKTTGDIKGQVGGYRVAFADNKFEFVTAHGGGHMVPTTRPVQGFQIIENFLSGEWEN